MKRAAGRGTDGTDDDEITDVLNKNTGVTWADVVKKGVDVGDWRNSRANKIVVSKRSFYRNNPVIRVSLIDFIFYH